VRTGIKKSIFGHPYPASAASGDVRLSNSDSTIYNLSSVRHPV